RAAFMADIAHYVATTVDAIRAADPPAAPPAAPGAAAARYPQRGHRRWQRRRTSPTRAPRAAAERPRAAAAPPRAAAERPRPPAACPAAPARRPPPGAVPELPCPRRQIGPLITGSRGWGCARWRDGCRFVIWFETAGRRLTAAQLRDLVTRGKTRKARFRSGG